MPFVVTICATASYTYAMLTQARRVCANISTAGIHPKDVVIILVGDNSAALKRVLDAYKDHIPLATHIHIPVVYGPDNATNYKEEAQLLIAKMREAAHAAARALNAEQCWSLDSDVLPPANALRCMRTMLEFDNGFYSVSTCPYPNTAFLGGFGTPEHPIAEDFLPHERKLPPELKAEFDANEAESKALTEPPSPEQLARWDATNKKIRECPPDGTIWDVIAKHGWRRRGWLDNAYPGIGRGAVVPSDWCGFGCTLMNREALALADFAGYEGHGTEDLFVCWHRWHPAGLRINVITHCPCDHVIWDRKKEGGDATKYNHIVAYHEQRGEARGHLRTRSVPWKPET
ncbi:MAG: hypothetical protein BWY91_01389 [bacterium ADurb.BinA028]|nr:MAG: hypothetical protein BWY91_01389 [bacterium ADurb.BinA028]